MSVAASTLSRVDARQGIEETPASANPRIAPEEVTGETTGGETGGVIGEHAGSFAAEHLSPSFPERAAWGTATKLRAWQAEALTKYFEKIPRDFLASATPGAGKTTFALRLATELLRRRIVERVTVVAPTEHLKKQWAEAAARVGMHLDPNFRNSAKRSMRGYHGVAVTYAQVAMKPYVHAQMTESAPTLVILDEVHHGGDALSWGDAIREAFGKAEKRVSLTGTPFRSDTAPIPFVTYQPNDQGIRISVTDYGYGYGRALADGVVRPVLFMTYAGEMTWRTSTGDEMTARLAEGNTKDITAGAWRTALDPNGEWMSSVLKAADRRLSEVRQHVPDAGGLVLATDQDTARAYADILESITKKRPTLVLSDDEGASARIEQFSESDARWMVAVRMVSEGVDVPRLCVGVYATSSSTPLFFAQAIGRFVRARRRGEVATVFLPAVPTLTDLAHALEVERDHALDRVEKETGEDLLDDSLLDEANRPDTASDDLERVPFQALGSEAQFERVLFDGEEWGQTAEVGSLEELDFIGIPGILEPDQVRDLLAHRQARQSRRAEERLKTTPKEEQPRALYRTLSEQRSLLNSLVGLYAKLSGQPHGVVHAEARRLCGGPEVSRASVTQLQQRIDYLRKKIDASK